MADRRDACSTGAQIGRSAQVSVRHLPVDGGIVHIKTIVGLSVHLTPNAVLAYRIINRHTEPGT